MCVCLASLHVKDNFHNLDVQIFFCYEFSIVTRCKVKCYHPIHYILLFLGGRVMVFNATFNNISVIPWRSVFLVKETEVPREIHRPVVNH